MAPPGQPWQAGMLRPCFGMWMIRRFVPIGPPATLPARRRLSLALLVSIYTALPALANVTSPQYLTCKEDFGIVKIDKNEDTVVNNRKASLKKSESRKAEPRTYSVYIDLSSGKGDVDGRRRQLSLSPTQLKLSTGSSNSKGTYSYFHALSIDRTTLDFTAEQHSFILLVREDNERVYFYESRTGGKCVKVKVNSLNQI